MTRLRYSKVKTSNHLLVSNTSIVLPDGKVVKIYLDTQQTNYQLVDVDNGQTITTEASNSLLNLKKLVRNTLLQLGVPLDVEKKTKRTTGVAA